MQPDLSPLLPIGEWRPDFTGPEIKAARVVTNCISQGPDYAAIESFLDAGVDALPGTCRGSCAVRDSSGNIHIFAGTKTGLYKLNTNMWTDVTRLSGAYSVPENERWVFAQYGDRVIAADYSDDTQYYDLGLSAVFDALPNAPKCRAMTVVNNFLMMVNTFDSVDQSKPKRARWSGLDDTEAWTPDATTQSDFQDLEDSSGEALAVVGYQQYAIIIKHDAIIRAAYVGTPDVFTFDTAETNQGTVGGNTVAAWGNRIFYLAEDGFYMFRDGAGSSPIGYLKLDRWFLADVKPGTYPKITTTINPLKKLVVWGYVSNLSADGLPDKALLYNWADDRWTLQTGNVAQLFISLQVGKTIEDLEAEYGNLEDVPLSLDSAAYAGGTTLPAAFSNENKLGYYNGDVMEATFETEEARMNETGRAFVSSVAPLTDGDDVIVQVITRNLPTDADTVGAVLTLVPATGEYSCRSDARYHRLRMTIGGNWTYMRGYQYRARAGAQR